MGAKIFRRSSDFLSPVRCIAFCHAKMQEVHEGEFLHEMDDLKSNLEGQMLSIAADVARVQKELLTMKVEALGEIEEHMSDLRGNLSEVGLSSLARGEATDRHEEFDGGDEQHDGVAVATGVVMTPEARPSRRISTSVLRRRSAYDSGGKRETLAKGGITWSPTVKDNAKGPGEDSLSDVIKKRSLRSRNARQRGGSDDGGSLVSVTIMYMLFVFFLSNAIPKVLQHFLRARTDYGTEGTHDDF